MATLDDKLMGEKLEYYCSSSEDEDGGAPKFVAEEEIQRGQGWNGQATNTGPKGVIADWQRYKQLEKENREDAELEKLELAKKLSMTCRTDREDQEAKEKEDRLEEELDALLDDDFMHDYMEKRMRQMIEDSNSKKKHFGTVLDLADGDAFLRSIDKEDADVVVLICIYEHDSQPCKLMLKHLDSLAKDYPMYKFCKILSTIAGVSQKFTSSGVPAILVYQNGELVTNFVRISDTLGEDFFAADVESYLVEHGVLKDKDLVPSIIKGPAVSATNDSDSD